MAQMLARSFLQMPSRVLCAACTCECDGKGSKGVSERTASKMMLFVKGSPVRHDIGQRNFAAAPITSEDRWCLRNECFYRA